MEFGSAVHAAVAAGLTGQSPETAVRQLRLKTAAAEKTEEAIDLAMRFLRRYSPQGTYLVEQKVRGTVAGEEFVGRLDLVEETEKGGATVITDFKTDWEKYLPTEKMQLPLYAYLFFSTLKRKPAAVHGRLWFLRFAREPVTEELITPETMLKAVEWAEVTIEQIREALEFPGWMGFDAKPGTACKTCGYSLACLELADPGDITEAGALALRLERALETVKERLKRHVQEYGPLQVNDQYWGDYSYSVWKFPDVAAFMELLAEAGEDPWDYIEVNGSKLKKLLKGSLGERLKQIGEEKPRHYFTHRGKPPGSNGSEEET